MLPDTETTPVTPKITTVFVKVKKEVDIGHPEFMKIARVYIRKNQQIPFGLRDASRTSFEISLTAEVGDGNVDAVIADLTLKAHAIADRELRGQAPETFKEAEKQAIPEEAFTVASTVVERATADGEDY